MYFQGEDTREPSLYISWEQELSWLEFHGFHLNVRESHQAGSTRQELVRADCRLCSDLILRCTNYCRLSVSTALVVTGLSADDVLCLLYYVYFFFISLMIVRVLCKILTFWDHWDITKFMDEDHVRIFKPRMRPGIVQRHNCLFFPLNKDEFI